jgi:tRNA threonylcarbamoyladenosine biosynthesis protein TsaB
MSTILLALESATEACSVALWLDGAIESCYHLAPQQQRQQLLPMVAQLLAQAGLSLTSVDALAFSQGPGSFTGVRLGLGVSQGLAFGADRPLIGLSTLMILAQGAYRLSGSEQVVAAIDARLKQIYWGSYQRQGEGWQAVTADALSPPASAIDFLASDPGPWRQVGTGWSLINADQGSQPPAAEFLCYPHAQDLLPLAVSAWQRGEAVVATQARPCYLRDRVALTQRELALRRDHARPASAALKGKSG